MTKYGTMALVLVVPTIILAVNGFIEFVNPVTAETHQIYLAPGPASKTALFHKWQAPEGSWSEPERISRPGHGADDPAIAIDAAGGVYAAYVWHVPEEQIHIRRRDPVTRKWSPTVRWDSESSQVWGPSIAVYNRLFVAANSSGKAIAIDINKEMAPDKWVDPWGQVEFESFQPDPGSTIHYEMDHVWMTYIYDNRTLRWVEYEDGWRGPYSMAVGEGINGYEEALKEIRHRVLYGE